MSKKKDGKIPGRDRARARKAARVLRGGYVAPSKSKKKKEVCNVEPEEPPINDIIEDGIEAEGPGPESGDSDYGI